MVWVLCLELRCNSTYSPKLGLGLDGGFGLVVWLREGEVLGLIASRCRCDRCKWELLKSGRGNGAFKGGRFGGVSLGAVNARKLCFRISIVLSMMVRVRLLNATGTSPLTWMRAFSGRISLLRGAVSLSSSA